MWRDVLRGYAYRDGNVWRWHERIMNSTTGRNFQECEEQVKDLLGDVCPALLDCPKLSYDKVTNQPLQVSLFTIFSEPLPTTAIDRSSKRQTMFYCFVRFFQ